MTHQRRGFCHRQAAPLLIFLMLLCGVAAKGQGTYTQVYNYGYEWQRGNFLTALGFPGDTTRPHPSKINNPHWGYKNGQAYFWDPVCQCYKLPGGFIDSFTYATRARLYKALDSIKATIPAITSLNGATNAVQSFAFTTAAGTMGWATDGTTGVHTLRIPIADASGSGSTTGLVSGTTQTFAGRKTFNAGIVLPTINQTADTTDWKPLVRHSTGVVAQGWWYGSGGGSSSTLSTLTYGATTTWDYSVKGKETQVTLTGNTALSIANLPAGQVVYLTLEVTQDATGSRTLTLPAGTKVIGGGSGAISLTTTGGATDLLTFRWNGTTLFCNYGKNYN